MKKHIVLVGGSGVVGSILTEAWQVVYRITVIDLVKPNHAVPYIQGDAANYDEIRRKLPEDTDVIINLLKVNSSSSMKHLDKMIDVYFKATCNILYAAAERNIPKVIFASSNHVTDAYEKGGKSKLGRPINVHDYPYSMGMYGILKLASENVGYMISREKGLSVINIRIGSVPENETQALKENERIHHTLLTRVDTAALFQAAMEADVKYGTYYGVSDNPGKPWDTTNAQDELGFVSVQNSSDLVNSQVHRDDDK
ncbi:NAD-dependent epimerase/dehydratase family protein [Marinicrinis lubricantis]|uniref:NAD-dependent epimerase/dehydratase family protein n=1 Tax=Marinicrinis lubricantis TaxID=2086470 RepID=A0ABW1IVH4_9BACL